MPPPSTPHLQHASANTLAHWVVVLMGWVWLGEQGQRLGWSSASGVLAVALWWTLRIVFGQVVAGVRWPRRAPLALGLATAGGVLLMGQASAAWLLAVAVPWALWSVSLEATRPQPFTGGAPLVAAGLTWAAVFLPLPGAWPGLGVALVLLAAALVSKPAPATPPGAPTVDALPQTAMGLMMGSLWLGSAWCGGLGAGVTNAHSIGLHLLLMTALPSLCPAAPHSPPARQWLAMAVVLAACTALWAGDQRLHNLTGMALLALACALSARAGHAGGAGWHASAARATAFLGPVLLIAIGVWSPLLGPQALQQAYGLLAALALAALVQHAWRELSPRHPRSCW